MTMLEPLGHHALLLFWLQLLVLFGAARLLGLLAQRFGQPSVVGELTAGLIVGPSLFGRLAPGAAQWLFPGDAEHSGTLLAIAWLGVILLLVETGFETDLGLLRKIGRSTAMVPIGSLFLPLGMGIGMGFVMPDAFVADDRVVFALFMGVCLAVSSLPVVAKILIELKLMRRNVGQVIIVAGMADDIVGWLMLSALSGAAAAGGFQAAKLGVTIASLIGFVIFAVTIGQRATDALLRAARRRRTGDVLPLTAVMFIVLVAASITQAIGIEAVFGAFAAGIVVARSRWFPASVERTIHSVTHGFLAPIFFATAGMYVDLGQLANGQVLTWALIVLAVASFAKLVGSYVGARMGPLGHREALAVGIGLNARGALEIIIATIALSLGVFNQSTYTVIVLLAMATSMAAPPLLRWALSNIAASDEEAQRLEQEELLASSVIAKASSALLPSRGGANSVLAARLLGLALRPEARVTILTVRPHEGSLDALPKDHLDTLRRGLGERPIDHRDQVHEHAEVAIREEVDLGYDLLALGMNEDFRGTHQLSEPLRSMLGEMTAPILLVRRGQGVSDHANARFDRILVPVSGTAPGRAAEEIAHGIAASLDSHVDLVHVVARTDADRESVPVGVGQLSRARDMAERFGRGASSLLRTGAVTAEEILQTAKDRDVDLIVMGATLRLSDQGQPFLGHGTEFVLQHAPQTVAVVLFAEQVDARE